jgi:hypothetical protein
MTALRLPDFVIAGAPRSGTTWLAEAIDRNPHLWLAKPLRPEPKFFLVDDLYARGLDWYAEQWFAAAPAGATIGEKSTNYLESETAARRMAAALPDVKLLFMLRDPVARAISNYRWSVMNGLESEPLDRALDLEPARERQLPADLRYARPHAYFSRGLYARLLRPWFDLFPSEQILCLRFEDATSAPAATVAQVAAYLGVPASDHAGADAEPVNASTGGVDIDASTIARLRTAYEGPNRELRELLGPSFRVWSSMETAS